MKVAIVSAKGLGDGLISMVLSHNFFRSGHQVTTYSTPLSKLRRWFEGQRIAPHLSLEKYDSLFSHYDLVISQAHTPISDLKKPNLIVCNEQLLNKKRSLVDNFVHLCKDHFSLPYYERSNAISPPSSLVHKKESKRIILHPFGTAAKKEWPLAHYLSLAKLLQKEGYRPAFIGSSSERERLLSEYPEVSNYEVPHFYSIDELAVYLYESAALIGNDSGPGHLASNLGLPTLSLFARKNYAKLWRPGFSSLGQVVTPLPFALGARAKEKALQTLLSPARVLSHFHKISCIKDPFRLK